MPSPITRLTGSFYVLGLFHNILYVVFVSAAVTLLPPSVPKAALVLTCILPSLLAKLFLTTLQIGPTNFTHRLALVVGLSIAGLLICACSESTTGRLGGVALASVAGGFGEPTVLQLAALYSRAGTGNAALSGWSGGTGMAGAAGAVLWWNIRWMGPRNALLSCVLLPLMLGLTYWKFLPPLDLSRPSSSEHIYLSVAVSESDAQEEPITGTETTKKGITTERKWALLQSVLPRYILSLSLVYLFEYLINQGVAPTLIYQLPGLKEGLSRTIRRYEDYYPLYAMVYQITVWLSRSWLLLGLRPLPRPFLPGFPILQTLTFTVLASQAMYFWFNPSYEIHTTLALITLEGLLGGGCYVLAFYHLDQEHLNSTSLNEEEKAFQISCVTLGDASVLIRDPIRSSSSDLAQKTRDGGGCVDRDADGGRTVFAADPAWSAIL